MPPSKKTRLTRGKAAGQQAPVGGGSAIEQLMRVARLGNGAAMARLLAAGADPNASLQAKLFSWTEEVFHTTLHHFITTCLPQKRRAGEIFITGAPG